MEYNLNSRSSPRKFTTAVNRKMNHFCATAVARTLPLQDNFHAGSTQYKTAFQHIEISKHTTENSISQCPMMF